MAVKVICPNCKAQVPAELFYSELGRIRTKKKSASSARNGTKGGGQPNNQNWKGRIKSG